MAIRPNNTSATPSATSTPGDHSTARAPDRRTWLGRRDHALMVLMIQPDPRLGLTGLRIGDLHRIHAHIRVTGKGTKIRSPTLTTKPSRSYAPGSPTPRRPTRPAAVPHPARPAAQPLHRRHDHHPTHTTAAVTCTTLPAKRITPHTLRHTNAILLRANNVDITTSRYSLDHETTQQRTSTSTPTPPSRNEQYHQPPHSEPSRTATTDPTNSWRSPKRCDYVEHLICQTLRCKGNRSRQVSIQHNRAWDIQPVMWNST